MKAHSKPVQLKQYQEDYENRQLMFSRKETALFLGKSKKKHLKMNNIKKLDRIASQAHKFITDFLSQKPEAPLSPLRTQTARNPPSFQERLGSPTFHSLYAQHLPESNYQLESQSHKGVFMPLQTSRREMNIRLRQNEQIVPPKRQQQLYKNLVPNFFLKKLKKKKEQPTTRSEKLQIVIDSVKQKNQKRERSPIIKKPIADLLKKINKRIKFMKEEKKLHF